MDSLRRVISPYFNQDWPDEFGTSSEALLAIVMDEPRDLWVAAIPEIDAILAARLDEDSLSQIVINQIGCFYDPSAEDENYTDFLTRVQGVFQQYA